MCRTRRVICAQLLAETTPNSSTNGMQSGMRSKRITLSMYARLDPLIWSFEMESSLFCTDLQGQKRRDGHPGIIRKTRKSLMANKRFERGQPITSVGKAAGSDLHNLYLGEGSNGYHISGPVAPFVLFGCQTTKNPRCPTRLTLPHGAGSANFRLTVWDLERC